MNIGLDDAIGPYVQFFINNNVTGQGLLNMTTEDLNKLHVEKIGHQVNQCIACFNYSIFEVTLSH